MDNGLYCNSGRGPTLWHSRARPLLPSLSAAMDQDAAGDEELFPSDTLAALQLLRAQFPPVPALPKLLLTSQLYSVLTDRTAADRELARLAAAGAVRRFKLATGRDEYAFMLAADYAAAVDVAGDAAEGAAEGKGAAFTAFKLHVLPACPGTHVAAAELKRLLAGPGGLGGEGALAALSRLLNAGLVARAMESSANSYVFAAPGAVRAHCHVLDRKSVV